MKGNLSDQAHINHICDAINEIGNYVKYVSFNNFSKSSEKKFASVKQLEIIGEASKNIPSSVKQANRNIPWKDMSGYRDFITHSYFEASLRRVWKVATEEILKMKENFQKIKLL